MRKCHGCHNIVEPSVISYRLYFFLQYLLDPAKGMTGAEVNQLHVHGGSALMEVGVLVRLCLSRMCKCGRVRKGSTYSWPSAILFFHVTRFTERLLAIDVRDIRVKQASTSGNVGVINLLLKKGADVSVTDKDGVTTLMSAASHGHAQVGALVAAPFHGTVVSCSIEVEAFFVLRV